MKLSVIIPTYNGAHKIPNVLHALKQQTMTDFEIIVVIDGSTDGTAALLRKMQPDHPNLRIIEQPNGGRAKVRNRGAKEAQGELLVFFDDDMRPGPNAVLKHWEHQQKHPGSIVTGSTMEEFSPDMEDFARFKAELSRKWSKNFSTRKLEGEAEAWLAAANFSISATNFRALGGFDENLNDAEDHDLSVRAYRHGIDLHIDPTISAWHDDYPNCSAYIRRLRQYAVAHKQLAVLKPEIYGEASKYTAAIPTGLKALVFSMFCSGSLVRSIDKGFWNWLPKSLRYRLYDLTITANSSYFPDKVAI